MSGILDVFKQDAFSVVSLTDAINEVEFIPGAAGREVDWVESGVPTTTIAIERKGESLVLVDPTPRGSPGTAIAKPKRDIRNLAVPHYEVQSSVMADEIQGVRAFGQESEVEVIQTKVNERMREMVQLSIDPTLEYQRIGAVKGIILNGNGDTLYNLFDEFGVTQDAEIGFDVVTDNSATGGLRKKVNAALRLLATNLKGTPFRGVKAFCGDTFYDALVTNKEVVQTYLNWTAAADLRGNAMGPYEAFPWAGITWINYRGAVGATAFVDATKCHIFPVGVPGLFRTVYAPADYVETVNTNGLPRYARQYEMQNGKGIHLDAQSNALNYCTRPKALLKGKSAA